MLLYQLSQRHLDRVVPSWERMWTKCIATVAAEAYEAVKEE